MARLWRDRGVENWFRFSVFIIMSKSVLFKGPNLFKFKCKTTFLNSNKYQTETITLQNACVKCSTLRGVRPSRTVLLFYRSLLRSGWGFKVCAPKRHRKSARIFHSSCFLNATCRSLAKLAFSSAAERRQLCALPSDGARGEAN